MNSIVMPKNSAKEDEMKSVLKIYYDANQEWVDGDSLRVQLKELIGAGQYPSSYSKKAQIPAYYGFIEWQSDVATSPRRITQSGVDFYESWCNENYSKMYEIIIKACETIDFGRNNFGAPSSRSDVQPPNVFIRSVLDLGYVTNAEFAYILQQLADRFSDYTEALDHIRQARSGELKLDFNNLPNAYTDAKPITFLKTIDFVVVENGKLTINKSVLDKYETRLRNLKIYSVDRNVGDISAQAITRPRNLKDELGLQIGMKSIQCKGTGVQGDATILDDDDYCYQVLSTGGVNPREKTGVIKLSTISKPLVKEWINYLRDHPTASADDIRHALSGQSEIDRYEYANSGPIHKLARMALGTLDYTIVDVSQYWHRRVGSLKKPEQKSQASTLPSKDLLTIALRLFSTGRLEEVLRQKSFDEHVAEAREEYSKITGDSLVACDYAVFRTGLVDSYVASVFFSKHTDEDKRKLGDFMAGVRTKPQDISVYLEHEVGVRGVGDVMLTSFLMRSRPDIYCTYSKQMFESMKFLGLLEEDELPELTSDTYATFKAAQTVIRDRMRALNIYQEKDDLPADYWTVNEFTWWLDENKDLMKEEVVKMGIIKKTKDFTSRVAKKSLEDFAGDDLMCRLMAALKTKPFAILAGHSGTGKSRLVRRLAYMTCNEQGLYEEAKEASAPGNYCMVQVKPNWHDSTDLLGYYSELSKKYQTTPFVEFICKAYAHPETPFFLCLDEMNLAPVEHYFAEYLSAIESGKCNEANDYYITDALVDKKRNIPITEFCPNGYYEEAVAWIKTKGLTIPKNLFVVGTVNMDETTHQFSRKVLDRAMTILMDDVNFEVMVNESSAEGKAPDPAAEELLNADGINFLLKREVRGKINKDDATALTELNKALENTPFKVAYRFANEYALYREAIKQLNKNANALDHMVLMKLLPRIHGEKGEIEKLFGKDASSGLRGVLKDGLSSKKMDEILKRGSEYLTFWP